jgi:hypothetical protein
MEWYNYVIVLALFLFIGLIYPWLQKFRAWQFYSLIILALGIGYLLNVGQPHNNPWYYYVLCVLLVGNLAYRAIKFYNSIK